jgi:hypothetical protein
MEIRTLDSGGDGRRLQGRAGAGFPDLEWARIEPPIPHRRRGTRRAADRLVIGGIVFDDRFRRMFLLAAHPGEGRFT